MNLRSHIRAAVLSVMAVPAGAQSLPATPPTAAPSTLSAPIVGTPTTERPHHAEVTYAAGLLDVRANNSSLNQILRQISTLTGMTIVGGVADERVFGNYGPADASTILATLLSGTGSNMLLSQSDATGTPIKLTLTPRNGNASPPSPTDASYNEEPQPALLPQRIFNPPNHLPSANTVPDNNGPQPIPPPQNNVLGSPSNTDATASTTPTTDSVPIDSIPTPSTTQEPTGIVDAPNPPPPGSTTGSNPNGVATPEQIYEQLKALQKKSQQNTPTTPQ